jgi:nucleotide-binding universal stress UspA family protein
MPHADLKILYATDFSDGADAAAEVALRYARRLGAALHVLHVAPHGSEEEMTRLLRDRVQALTGVSVTAVVETGSAAERIVRHAQANAIDLIVLGTHGRTGFTHALLGSVAERVARTAPCPVMTVPHATHAGRRPGAATTGAMSLAPEESRACLVCHAPCSELICDACRARIRGEALERRQEEYRKVPV